MRELVGHTLAERKNAPAARVGGSGRHSAPVSPCHKCVPYLMYLRQVGIIGQLPFALLLPPTPSLPDDRPPAACPLQPPNHPPGPLSDANLVGIYEPTAM